MPLPRRKYARKRKTRKRVYRKRTRKPPGKSSKYRTVKSFSTQLGRNRSPFPPTMFTVMEYSTTVTLTQGTSAIPTLQQFSGNGIYDPDITGFGIQPRYYDTLLGASDTTAPYTRYRVHGSSIKVTSFNSLTAVSSQGYISIIPSNSSVTTPSSLQEMKTRPYSKYRVIGMSAAEYPKTTKNYMKTKTLFSIKDLRDNNDCSAAYNSNPPQQWYWQVNTCNVFPTATITNVIEVKIRYFVELYELADVADS